MSVLIYINILTILFFSCISNNQKKNANVKNKNTISIDSLTSNNINSYIDTLFADGFDYPIGNADGKGKYTSKFDSKTYDSWYIATKYNEKYSLGIHPGVDFNGTGGGNTDLGQSVYSIAKGIVIDVKNYGTPWGNVVLIKHKYLINGSIKYCYSLYAHLDEIKVNLNDTICKRAEIGSIGTAEGSFFAHLHFEIRKELMNSYETTYWPSSDLKDSIWLNQYYENPTNFINSNRKLTCPYLEQSIIIAIKNKYKLYYYEFGILINEYEIALSQNPIGHKEKEGDLKLPEGEYYISEKQTGPFFGNFSEFLGNRLLRISYPNTFDAQAGFAKGYISKQEKIDIIIANTNNKIPSKNSKLGGGIVIHGWVEDWIADGNQNLTWGCISMHNSDIEEFYNIINLNTKIIISP